MTKQIAKLLKADLNSTSNLAMIAKMLERKGRANDTILAHITQKEAEMLKGMGGAGTVNPETGLLEFFDVDLPFSTPDYSSFTQEASAPAETQVATGREVTPVTADVPPVEATYIKPGDANYVVNQFGNQITPSVETTTAEDTVGTPSNLYALSLQKAPAQFSTLPSKYALTQKPDYSLSKTGGAETTPTAPEKSFLDKLSTDQLVRLGLVGGLGAMGAQKAKTGARQAQAAAGEERAIGAPYQAKGSELQRAAQAGELTATGQQSLQALQARLAQGVESRGGVGVAQAAAQAEAYRQQLLAQQYNLGLQVSQIGDNIALGAIRTGLQADQQLSQASTNFYTNLAMIGAGIPMYSQTAPTAARGQ